MPLEVHVVKSFKGVSKQSNWVRAITYKYLETQYEGGEWAVRWGSPTWDHGAHAAVVAAYPRSQIHAERWDGQSFELGKFYKVIAR